MTAGDAIPVILVRHASTAWTGHRYCGRSDPPLDAAGRAAAERLARDLTPDLAPGTRIVSSPLVRAVATAEAIATAAGLGPVLVDERWLESDCGIAEGRTFDELAVLEPRLAARLAAGDVDIDWPAGETALALRERVHDAWSSLLADRHPVVIVSHAGPLRLALALGTGSRPETVVFPVPGTAVRLTVPGKAGAHGRRVAGSSRATLRR
jgi:broad specificity phosphatase PhoE